MFLVISDFAEREVLPSHSEATVLVNDESNSFTGTSGVIAWKLDDLDTHLLVMWSVPYNLNFYNSYFAIGIVKLEARSPSDLLPYWYKQLLNHKKGTNYIRGKGGEQIVMRHHDFFVVSEFGSGYHPFLNIR